MSLLPKCTCGMIDGYCNYAPSECENIFTTPKPSFQSNLLSAAAPDLESVKEEVRRRIEDRDFTLQASDLFDRNYMINVGKKYELQDLLTWLEGK